MKVAMKMIWIAPLLLISTAAQAATCPTACPGGMRDVSLLVTDSSEAGSSRWEGNVRSWYDHVRPASLPPVPTTYINEPAGLRNAILGAIQPDAQGRCGRIKFMAVFSHGAAGAIAINHQTFNSANAGLILSDLGCAMAPDAAIELAGCNVALGCRGEDLLVAMAQNLLPAGGRIRGAQQYVVSFGPGLIAARSVGGSYQELRVGAGLSNPRFSSAPQTQEACIDRSESRLGQLREVSERVRHCPTCAEGQTSWCVAERDRRLLDSAISELLNSSTAYREIGGTTHASFDPASRRAAAEYRWGHLHFEMLQRRPIWGQQSCPVDSLPPATDLRGIREERMRRAMEAD